MDFPPPRHPDPGPLPRPRGQFGVVNWEHFFEHPTEGLVALIKQARSRDVLHKCAAVIVQGLFARKDDDLHRQAFLRAIDDIINTQEHIGETKALLIDLLRQVKSHRQARAREYVDRKQAEDAAKAEAERRAAEAVPEEAVLERVRAKPQPSEPSPPPRPRKAAAPAPENPTSSLSAAPHDVFCRTFSEIVRERLEVIRRGAKSPERIRSPIPFAVSEAFADHFGRIVEVEIAPMLAERVTSIIRPAEDLPPEDRRGYMREQIDEYKNRRALWAAWQDVWKAATRKSEIPPEPEEEKKGALDFLKKKEKLPAWKRKMTREEWTEAVATITAANERADRIWAELTAPSPRYEPPGAEDNEFLMELFALSPQAISQHIQALRQIVQQGGEIGRTFDTYRKNKNMDLPLLGACYWYPDLFLEGKTAPLKALVSGYARQDLPRLLPYTSRFLDRYLA
jgi:hypothetical protein